MVATKEIFGGKPAKPDVILIIWSESQSRSVVPKRHKWIGGSISRTIILDEMIESIDMYDQLKVNSAAV